MTGYTLAQVQGYLKAVARQQVEQQRNNAIAARMAQVQGKDFKKYLDELKGD